MPDAQRTATHVQTYVVDAEGFSFETIEQENGQATVIRFGLDDPRYQAGDVAFAEEFDTLFDVFPCIWLLLG